ncbi:MAG: hypothetical protein COB41_00460 [Proteobacteria bacterium]|nr:MAG: hypothetical protein COB41_00460 [Pseudomonadota bacterium]
MSQDNSDRIYDKIDKIDAKIERKFEKMDQRLDNVEKQLIIYNGELSYHIEGVNQAKKQNEILKTYIDVETEKLIKDFAPIKKHVESLDSFFKISKSIFNVLLKVAGACGILIGIYAKYKGVL